MDSAPAVVEKRGEKPAKSITAGAFNYFFHKLNINFV